MLNDKWIRIIGYPTVVLIMSVVFGYEEWQMGGKYILITIGMSAMYTALIWEGCRRIIVQVRKRFPGFANTKKRLVIQIIIKLSYTFLISLLMQEVHGICFPGETKVPYLAPFVIPLILIIPVIIFLLVYELTYFLQEWKKYIQETEAIAREHLQSQFEALKKQLDPHFLFNSLNTLASLIDQQNEPAQDFLERLSDVYRYVLETRDKMTVSVEEELTFLDAYLYLIKVRFRDNLQVEQDLPAHLYGKHIPALSLQLLVENAIKHNVISSQHPLVIRLYEESGELVVENNKQLKKTLGDSTKVGLQNIMSRYSLLGTERVTVLNREDLFTVKLPLLSSALT